MLGNRTREPVLTESICLRKVCQLGLQSQPDEERIKDHGGAEQGHERGDNGEGVASRFDIG